MTSASKSNAGLAGAEVVAQNASQRDVSFVPAWRLRDKRIEQGATEFWRRHNLMNEPIIEERISQLCAAGYVGEGIVALSTAEPFEWMGLRFLEYRCSVSPSYRHREITWRLTAFVYALTEKWSLENPQEKIVGLLAAMEASEFIGHLALPVLSKHGLDLVFVGHTPNGHQLRAMWYKHANVEASILNPIQP